MKHRHERTIIANPVDFDAMAATHGLQRRVGFRNVGIMGGRNPEELAILNAVSATIMRRSCLTDYLVTIQPPPFSLPLIPRYSPTRTFRYTESHDRYDS